MLEEAGAVIAGLGMMVIDWPPHPSHPADHRRVYILNVFVEPKHRRRGLAKRLMSLAETRAREFGVSCAILFDAAGTRTLREPRMGADERDGDPLGVGCSNQDDLPI
jgi:ribosomal protein S18 acetylase RimI-like enzyme